MALSGPELALKAFGVSSKKFQVQLLEQGLINNTYKVLLPEGDGLIVQRINPGVFRNALPLMQNIARVLPKLCGPDYTELKLLSGTDGNPWFVDTGGSYWRAFHYIPGSNTFQQSSDKAIARESGRIIGHFHMLVSDIPLKDIHTTLPDLHPPPCRAPYRRGQEGRTRSVHRRHGQERELPHGHGRTGQIRQEHLACPARSVFAANSTGRVPCNPPGVTT